MSSPEDLRATTTRAFAVTIAADSMGSYAPSEPVDDSKLPTQGDVVGLHYRLIKPLGEGNFGKVWVAERLDVPEHRVAMKILPRALFVGRNVERELVMLATVGHPNVVQLKDHGIEPEFVWLTMPVYEGETLAERLDRGTLSLREAYEIFLPVARAVEALHTLGLRHQDIKPENIFLARFGVRLHPVLLDLGVAAERDSTFVAGTALYAAPEQLAAILNVENDTPLSEKMDIYCIAATLLLCLVGDKHFPGAKALTRRQVIKSHETRSEKPLADDALMDLAEPIRVDLNKKFAKWMSVDPAARPEMSQLADELEILLEPEREAEREEDRAKTRARRALSRARWLAVVVLVAAGGVGGLALWKRETLRLASALEEARAAGAEHFDRLDTCVASHAVTSLEAKHCKTSLIEEEAEHEKTLTSLSKQGAGCGEAVEQTKDLRAKLKRNEEDLKVSKITCIAEKEKISTELGAERDKFKTERDTCQTSTKDLAAEVERLRTERENCQPGTTPPAGTSGPLVATPTGTTTPYDDPPPPTPPPTSIPSSHAPPVSSDTPPPPPPPASTTPVSQSSGPASGSPTAPLPEPLLD